MPSKSPSPLDLLLARHVEAENAHDMPGTLATLHPDCVFEDVARGRIYRGHDGATRWYREWWDAFGLRFERGERGYLCTTNDGLHIAEGEFFGKHVGPFAGLAPTGRDVRFRFAVRVDFRDGLMAGERFYYDLATVLKQLGCAHLPEAVA